MRPFREHTGIVLPLDRNSVDTDQIIPKQFLKRIERSGYGEFLFYDWRYTTNGSLNPNFVMNQERYRDASILVAGKNFGCGSSREHAAWALGDYGFRAVIAPSFADIFSTNAVNNGILLIILSEEQVHLLLDRAEQTPAYKLHVSLPDQIVRDEQGFSAAFPIESFRRTCLLEGLDEIGITLKYEVEIAEYEKAIGDRR